MHCVVGLRAFRQPFEFVADAVARDEVADRARWLCRRLRLVPAIDFGPERDRLGICVRQFDALSLALGAATRIPIIVRVDLAVFITNDGLSTPSGSVTPVSLFSCQSSLPPTPQRRYSTPSDRTAYGQHLPSASAGSQPGTCRMAAAGDRLSLIDPTYLGRFATPPHRSLGLHRLASGHHEASCPSCAPSFQIPRCASCAIRTIVKLRHKPRLTLRTLRERGQ
jgi:hypothetical protein